MKISFFDIMLPAFVECLVLVGIHSYLGIHVIKRKVIFVDLSLAQIAALGTTVAFLFGIAPSSSGAYWFSLGFTIIGAAIFSLSRLRHEKIPQEAIIGLVYALAASVAILVIDKAPQGSEHIKELLTGSILWVQWDTILSAAIMYAFVGIFHFVARDKFLLISNHPEIAYQKGLNVRLWDFLFYVTFGIVITHSVRTAGVLLVFVFLVVPAVATIMLTSKLWLQLTLGWIMGTLVSGVGLIISYYGDLPSGPTVVSTYGLSLLILSLSLYIIRASNRGKAIRNLGIGVGIFLLTIFLFFNMGKYFEKTSAHQHSINDEIEAHKSQLHKHNLSESNDNLKSEKDSTRNRQEYQEVNLKQLEDPFEEVQKLKKLVENDEKEGSKRLIRFLENTEVPFLREEALKVLQFYTGSHFGYDSFKSNSENLEALQKFHSWWQNKYN
jgi:zinc/manganese transport system permease protein